MLGSGNPTPYDLPVTALLVACAAALLAGLAFGSHWPAGLATIVRRGSLLIAIALVAGLYAATPTPNGIVGAGRLVTVWPAAALVVLLFAAWSLRAGRL